MITPQFEVSQDDDFVHVRIRAPYIKASMIQFEAADDTFVFSLPPYYLRLRFPAKVIEDERMLSRYDAGSATVHCQVAKLVPGEHFPDLDMLSKLLAKKNPAAVPRKPIIDEIGGDDDADAEDAQDDIDWEIEQTLPTEERPDGPRYGFDQRYKDIVGLSLHTGNEINEVIDPEKDAVSRDQVVHDTVERFDPEHYAADLLDDADIQGLVHWVPESIWELDGPERDRIMKLGHRKHLTNAPKQAYLALLQLVFGACYDYRTNMGDSTVESAWNVGKLAPCMCFLFNNYGVVRDVVVDCTSRALTVPLYRNWELTMKVWEDTLKVLQHGRKGCLKILARLLQIFESDLHFCYRQIWVDDMTVWVQNASEAVLSGLVAELTKALNELDKSMLPLNLGSVESQALASDDDGATNDNENVEVDSDDESS